MAKLIVIGGPTASGKTSLAIAIALRLNTVVLSADSRQFYREMRIGNARPSKAELTQVQHFFVAARSITEPLTAGSFAEEALVLLEQLFQQHEYIVVAGGSGLYIDALCQGLDEFPAVHAEAKQRVDLLYQSQGLSGLQEALREVDPRYAQEVDLHNARRLMRALEVSFSSGQPYSSFRSQGMTRPFQSLYFQPKLGRVAIPPNRLPARMQPDPEREWLYQRINQRVDLMMEAGLLDEAKALYPYRHLPVLQTVGYQEFWPFFEGEYNLERAVELIKRNSRRYAKRQITWFGRSGKYQAVTSAEELLLKI
ncbi:MAG: tRNA (adenosine(37)-N6)-dimethylallyltransferase MiaA [Bacteroidota bacterium]